MPHSSSAPTCTSTPHDPPRRSKTRKPLESERKEISLADRPFVVPSLKLTLAKTSPLSPSAVKDCAALAAADSLLSAGDHGTGLGASTHVTPVTTTASILVMPTNAVDTSTVAAATATGPAATSEICAEPGPTPSTARPSRSATPASLDVKVTRLLTSRSGTFCRPGPPKVATAAATVC
eukprot:2788499-Pleurochrysis_carterae.AAC.1